MQPGQRTPLLVQLGAPRSCSNRRELLLGVSDSSNWAFDLLLNRGYQVHFEWRRTFKLLLLAGDPRDVSVCQALDTDKLWVAFWPPFAHYMGAAGCQEPISGSDHGGAVRGPGGLLFQLLGASL